MRWKDKFSVGALSLGREYYEKQQVRNLCRTERGYQAVVGDHPGYEVRIGIYDDKVMSLGCECSAAQPQIRCGHMAAVLFAIEESGGKIPEKGQEEEPYSYFNCEALRASLDLAESAVSRAKKLIRSGEVKLASVDTGYTQYSDEMAGQAEGVVEMKQRQYRVWFVFSSDAVLHKSCECPKCANSYTGWYGRRQKSCEHMAALYLLLCRYLQEHQIGDATDRFASEVIRKFQNRRAIGRMEQEGGIVPLELQPRLIRKDGKFTVSFRVGPRNGKMFVIKNFTEFARLVRNGEYGSYGTSATFNHQIRNFSQKSRRYLSFISGIVSEEKAYAQRQGESFYSRAVSGNVGQQILLTGKRMDDFYDVLGEDPVEYDDRMAAQKKKEYLRCRVGNPQMTLDIRKLEDERSGIFYGILVTGVVPELLCGLDYTYYIEGTNLFRMTEEFSDCIGPLLNRTGGDQIRFQVGRHRLQVFYYTVLPKLREHLEIRIHDEELIGQYLQPEVRFQFFLDAERQTVMCRARAVYGEREISLMDCVADGGQTPDAFRDLFQEEEILYAVRKYFPIADPGRDEFCCADEDAVYRVLSSGVQELMGLGEVQSTDRFRRLKVVRSPKISVGVSLESGLVDLEISSGDLPQEELLEILQSYRQKKKYHRLRNGDFVAVEENLYGMLSELMDTLQISPKEFVRGKMQIPAYRALYLDKMMEEHETVYATRDSRFKKLIKDFKAIADADYEEPASLREILRNYQKTGYKWIRTLRDGHFGGILADDMGLGKTLQVIAALLALKEEGQGKPALIICPASLVFNWGEEIRRFAPALSFGLVTGNQEERRRKIERYADYDVLVTSYDLLKRDIHLYEGKRFGYEVIDEAQYIKNHTTAAAKSVKLVSSENRLALTGTPIENRLSELWSIFDYLMPGFLYRYENFKREFETRIVRQEDEETSGRLRRLVAPFILRRLKGDVLRDLPEKIEEVRYSRFEEEQQRLYDAQVVYMRQKLAAQKPEEFGRSRLEILRELTRLRQICCDPALCFEGYRGGSAKLESCLQLLESAVEGGHKVLLFSQFTTMLDRIRQAVEERGYSYYVITGRTPKEERLSLVKRFNRDEVPLFLISLKAGGTGLNLTGADVVVHYDPWWNVAVQNQATDRAHRIGQEKVVSVYKLIVKDSIEEKICRLQESKQDLADQIISGEMTSLAELTQEDLLRLLE